LAGAPGGSTVIETSRNSYTVRYVQSFVTPPDVAVEGRSSSRILKQALELFSSKGYDATAVREICEAAGITKPTLYHFFGSKEGVYRALVDGTLERFRSEIVRALGQPGSLRERLKRLARSYFEQACEHREAVRFIFGLIHNPPSSAPPTDFKKFHQEILQLVGACLDEGLESGELRPGRVDVRLLAFFGALGEAVCGNLVEGDPQLTGALADALVDTLLDGWTTRTS
jgi:TetR/AcrR family transcriptional regulator